MTFVLVMLWLCGKNNKQGVAMTINKTRLLKDEQIDKAKELRQKHGYSAKKIAEALDCTENVAKYLITSNFIKVTSAINHEINATIEGDVVSMFKIGVTYSHIARQINLKYSGILPRVGRSRIYNIIAAKKLNVDIDGNLTLLYDEKKVHRPDTLGDFTDNSIDIMNWKPPKDYQKQLEKTIEANRKRKVKERHDD